MSLLLNLGVTRLEDIDPSIPLVVGSLRLGAEAANEAVSIIRAGDSPKPTHLHIRNFKSPFYMEVVKDGAQVAEVFSIPSSIPSSLPTAVEIAIIRALASVEACDVDRVLAGGTLIILGEREDIGPFYDIITCIEAPLCGESALNQGGYSAAVKLDSNRHINGIVVECFRTSFLCSPLKFRFVELYRVMETRFLSDILNRVNASFVASPAIALKAGLSSLESEVRQLHAIAEYSQSYFEVIRTAIFALKDSGNAFAAAIVAKLRQHSGASYASQWKSGACLIYYIRCAIVHAGEKDIVFEAYADGNVVLEAVISSMEFAALACCGVEIT